MKKILLILFVPCIVYSQELPIDFSDASHQFNQVQGTDAEFNLITDPTDSTNDVAEIISSTAYSDVFELTLSRFIDVTNTSNNSISFDYYSTITGIRSGGIQLDDEQLGGLPIIVPFTTSGVIGWETITVDFDNAVHPYPNNSTPVTLSHYGKVALIFSNGNPPVVSTCYVDNISGAQNGNPYNIFDGDAILTTQQEVDNFGQMSYSKVLGSLKIISSTDGITTDITDLTSLSSIYSIGSVLSAGSLEIIDNNNLVNLDGLDNIKSIYGSMIIKNNSSLNSISDLSGLTTFLVFTGMLIIENNDSLISLDGLQNINQILADLSIIDNDSLVSISNLNIGSDEIIIENNQSLQTISDLDFNTNNTTIDLFHIKDNVNLSSLSNITGTVFISGQLIIDNSNLSDLTGLENIQHGLGGFLISDGLIIKNNNNLQSLNGLNTNLGLLGGVELDNNPLLSDISILSNRLSYAFLRFKNNPGLSNLNTLSPVTYCGEIAIEGVNGFTDLSGLENINCSVAVSILNTNLTDISQLGLSNSLSLINIEGNQSITDLSVFESLEIMVANGPAILNIINNNQLSSLDGFENLLTFYGDFNIEDNNVLNDFCAFSNLFSVGTFNISFSLFGNEYNPSQSQIANGTSCSLLSIDDYNLNSINIFPNPTTDYINIESNGVIAKAEIFNLRGQKIVSYENQSIIDVSTLPTGIYFLKITDGTNRTQNFKFIKDN